MEYLPFGCTGLRVSSLCLGTMTFGWTTDAATAHTIMDLAVAHGINFIDTANIYVNWAPNAYPGKTEEIIGCWLRRHQRDRLIIATKMRWEMSSDPNGNGLSRKHIYDAVEGSLQRLQTDYIDLCQLHGPDYSTPLEETFSALDDLRRSGKIRYVGCSNFPAWYVTKALFTSDIYRLIRLVSVQPHYNLVHRAEFERELLPLCQDQGLAVIPYSPLGGGFLTGKYRSGQSPPGSRGEISSQIKHYVNSMHNFDLLDKLEQIALIHDRKISQIALAWLIQAPTVTAPIIGSNSVEQFRENLGALDVQLTDEEWSTLAEYTKPEVETGRF